MCHIMYKRISRFLRILMKSVFFSRISFTHKNQNFKSVLLEIDNWISPANFMGHVKNHAFSSPTFWFKMLSFRLGYSPLE